MKIKSFFMVIIFIIFSVNVYANDKVVMEPVLRQIQYNGNYIDLTDQFGDKLGIYSYKGVTYVPLRSFAERLGKQIIWEEHPGSVYDGTIYIEEEEDKDLVFGELSNLSGEEVSMISIIADPQKYNGVKVCVQGVINIAFEGNRLFLHKEDRSYWNETNSIVLGLTSSNESYKQLVTTMEELQKITGEYVLMSGTIKVDSYGYVYITDIDCIMCLNKSLSD